MMTLADILYDKCPFYAIDQLILMKPGELSSLQNALRDKIAESINRIAGE
jgi:hypothetical protein